MSLFNIFGKQKLSVADYSKIMIQVMPKIGSPPTLSVDKPAIQHELLILQAFMIEHTFQNIWPVEFFEPFHKRFLFDITDKLISSTDKARFETTLVERYSKYYNIMTDFGLGDIGAKYRSSLMGNEIVRNLGMNSSFQKEAEDWFFQNIAIAHGFQAKKLKSSHKLVE